MKKKNLKYLFIIILIMLSLSTNVIAKDEKNNESVLYQKWSNLSENEKKKYIEPTPFVTKFNNNSSTFQNSKYGVFSRLKASYQDKYMLDELNVKNQQDTSECWAFSLSSVLESNIYKTRNKKTIFSPRHIDYSTTYTFLDGINKEGHYRELKSGGNSYIGYGYLTSGRGPVYESDMPFENNENKIKLQDIKNKKVDTQVKQYRMLPGIYKEYINGDVKYYNGLSGSARVDYTTEDVNAIRNQIKEHIIKYGAISTFTYAGQEESLKYYNSEKLKNGSAKTHAYFCDNNGALPDHAVTIVGWDDNYSADNFNDEHKPKSNGAYIVLNSYGTEEYNDGYLYISYDDILIESILSGVIETSDIEYDNIYQYDNLGYSYSFVPGNSEGVELKTVYMGNIFKCNNKTDNKLEQLTEVSFYIPQTSKVAIYANTESASLTGGKMLKDLGTLQDGYHTITLDNPIYITGDGFSVYVKISADNLEVPLELNYKSNGSKSTAWDTAKSEPGQSFLSADEKNWTDLTEIYKDSNVCVKAYTKYVDKKDIKIDKISLNKDSNIMHINDNFELTASISPDTALNSTLIWTSSDENIATIEKIDNTKVKVIAKSIGKCTITAANEDNSVKATCTISVENNNVDIPITSISLNVNEKMLYVGETFKIKATINPSNATNQKLIYESTDPKIAKIDNEGNITAISEGKTTVKVTNKESGKSASAIITVVNKETINNINDNNNYENTKEEINKFNKINNVDNTTASKIIPNAGITYVIIFAVLITFIIGIVLLIKLYKNRDIK